MIPEQREELVRLLQQGEELSPEWARMLFPPEKREYELVYHGKEREEDIIADTLAVPLQPVRAFGGSGVDWHNMLIFGDNLQAMKTLLEMKRRPASSVTPTAPLACGWSISTRRLQRSRNSEEPKIKKLIKTKWLVRNLSNSSESGLFCYMSFWLMMGVCIFT